MRAGPLRAREGGCGAGCAHLESISTPLPSRAPRDREEEVGPRVRGQSEGSDPAARCTWMGTGAKKACGYVVQAAATMDVKAAVLAL